MAGFDSTKYPLCEKVCHLFQKVDIFILVVVIVIAIWRQKTHNIYQLRKGSS